MTFTSALNSSIDGMVLLKVGSEVDKGFFTSSAVLTGDKGIVTVNGIVSVPAGTDRHASAAFNASLKGNTLTGVMHLSDRSSRAGKFTLTRKGVDPSLSHMSVYVGTAKDTCNGLVAPRCTPRDLPVVLRVDSIPPGTVFLSALSYAKAADVVLSLDEVVVRFTGCDLYDEGRIACHITGTQNGLPINLMLDCLAKQPGYTCQFQNINNQIQFNFELAPQTN